MTKDSVQSQQPIAYHAFCAACPKCATVADYHEYDTVEAPDGETIHVGECQFCENVNAVREDDDAFYQ